VVMCSKELHSQSIEIVFCIGDCVGLLVLLLMWTFISWALSFCEFGDFRLL
jgi:hypothetical protein